MNEKRIQQVLDIEQQAQTAYTTAVDEAKRLPAQAEQEAQQLIEQARADAEKEAQQLIASAQSEEESKRIMEQAEEKIRHGDAVARSNFDRAVMEVLCIVVGKE